MGYSVASPLEVEGIHHYTISVADIGRSVKWYHEKLGFGLKSKTSGRTEKTAWIINKAVTLKLIQVAGPNLLPGYRFHPATDNAVQGHKHFSLRVIHGPETEQELIALGVPIVFVPVVGDTYGIFICDPTGNLMEILQEEKPSCAPDTGIPGKDSVSIEGWSHTAISVPDMDAAVDWYGRVLGFPVAHADIITSPGGHSFKVTWLRGPGFSVELFEVPGSSPLSHDRQDPVTDIKTLGNKWFALEIKDMEKARHDLETLHVDILSGKADNSGSLFIRDNSGNIIELCR